jgi:hypothetical protein
MTWPSDMALMRAVFFLRRRKGDGQLDRPFCRRRRLPMVDFCLHAWMAASTLAALPLVEMARLRHRPARPSPAGEDL